jgi:hypothetical protein
MPKETNSGRLEENHVSTFARFDDWPTLEDWPHMIG